MYYLTINIPSYRTTLLVNYLVYVVTIATIIFLPFNLNTNLTAVSVANMVKASKGVLKKKIEECDIYTSKSLVEIIGKSIFYRMPIIGT